MLEKECVEEICKWEEWAEGAENLVDGKEEVVRNERTKKMFERKYAKCAFKKSTPKRRRNCLAAANKMIEQVSSRPKTTTTKPVTTAYTTTESQGSTPQTTTLGTSAITEYSIAETGRQKGTSPNKHTTGMTSVSTIAPTELLSTAGGIGGFGSIAPSTIYTRGATSTGIEKDVNDFI